MKPRELALADLHAVLAEVRRLQQHGYQRAAQWNLAQNCQHLTLAIHASVDGIAFKAPLLFRLIGPTLIKSSIFKNRKLREGVPAPASLVPDDTLDEQAEVQKLADAVEKFHAHPGGLQRHPFLGVLTPHEWEQFHTIHAIHHLRNLIPKS